MKASITRHLLKRIIAGAFIFYAFSGVASILNYIFYPAIARFVSIAEYGEIQFLVSMFTQLSVGFVVLNILSIIVSVELKKVAERTAAIHSLNVVAGFVALLITTIGITLLTLQQDALELQSVNAVIILGLALLTNVPFTIAVGKLQGEGRFILSGVVGTLAALLKLAFSVLFVWLGFGVTGAIAGIFIGMLACLVVIQAHDVLYKGKSSNTSRPRISLLSRRHLSRLRFVQKRAVVGLVVMTIITLLSTVDSIVSRIALSNIDAGHYSAIATIAKMILAATAPIMWLTLPSAIQHNKKSITQYLCLATGIGMIAALLFSVAPSFFTSTILGVDAGSFAHLMPLAALSMTACSVAFITLAAAVCADNIKAAVRASSLAVAVFGVTFAVLTTSHDALTASLWGQLFASLCYLLLLIPGLIRK